MLREILDNQDDIKEQVNIGANTFEIESNDDYYLIKNLNQLQKVLDKTSLNKTFAFTQKVNQAFKKIIKSYSSIIDLNEKYN